MLRWISLGLTLVCAVIVMTTKSAFALGIALLIGMVTFIAFVLSLAGDRVSAVSRPDTSMATPEQLAAMNPARRARPAAPGQRLPATPPRTDPPA